ncbi:MAG: UMP kinase, partial [Planctomycetota bacterium]
GEGGFGIDREQLHKIARQCVDVQKAGAELAIVCGGGNFIRGATFTQDGTFPRTTADYMGMLGTVINALALQETMEALAPGDDMTVRVMSAISISRVCEPFIRRKAIRHLEKGRAIILAAGTGNPFFTTDTCAALRAAEIEADALLKATKVDGIYDSDPKKNPDAKRYDKLTYAEAIDKRLKVMDMAAFTMCEERQMPVIVFDMGVDGNILRAVQGESVGTTVGA